MWILVTLTSAGLFLKFAAVYRCLHGYRNYRQYWYMPEIGFCVLFSLLTYTQIGLELYGYYVLYNSLTSTQLYLFRLYYIAYLATLFFLPIAIDIVVLRQTRVSKTVFCLMLWASISILVTSTDLIIAGAEPLVHSFTRIPGPIYNLIPIIVLAMILYSLGHLIVIALTTKSTLDRVKASNLIIGMSILLVSAAAVLGFMHIGIRINGTGILSFSMSLLIFILAGQFNDARIFDLRVLIPGTGKWKAFWCYSRHLHTVSVDPKHCQGLIDSYTENLIETASRVCTSQQQMAEYLGFSQATISRRMKQLIQNESADMQSDSK